MISGRSATNVTKTTRMYNHSIRPTSPVSITAGIFVFPSADLRMMSNMTPMVASVDRMLTMGSTEKTASRTTVMACPPAIG